MKRWLLFLLCVYLTVLPMHFFPFFNVPFRWEMSIVLVLGYGYDDARGAEAFFSQYVSVALWKLYKPVLGLTNTLNDWISMHSSSVPESKYLVQEEEEDLPSPSKDSSCFESKEEDLLPPPKDSSAFESKED